MDEKLIFDVCCHKGEDTEFYLKCGYKVIAFDALPKYIEYIRNRFYFAFNNLELITENCIIGNSFADKIKFYESSHVDWCSTNVKIASRFDTLEAVHRIDKKPLSHFIEKYGVPYYCKIDIEGNDLEALQSLEVCAEKPKFISCETECLGENEVLSEEQVLATLFQLHNLGYNKFQLVEQNSLRSVLFDSEVSMSAPLDTVRNKYGHDFQIGSSGVFGDMLPEGYWVNFSQATNLILKFREHWFKKNTLKCSFWCDWHAIN